MFFGRHVAGRCIGSAAAGIAECASQIAPVRNSDFAQHWITREAALEHIDHEALVIQVQCQTQVKTHNNAPRRVNLNM